MLTQTSLKQCLGAKQSLDKSPYILVIAASLYQLEIPAEDLLISPKQMEKDFRKGIKGTR